MSLPPEPPIDSRSYQQILNEALVRIPVHNPEWTNYNDSDPGVTILQLFAFMTESMLYRANLVPERNRLKFLRLLGVSLRPASSAEGLVAFSNPKGPLQVQLLPADVELLSGQVPFRTQDGLDVLPIEVQAFVKARPALTAEEEAQTQALYDQLYASLLSEGETPAYYETKPFEPASGADLPVVDLNSDAAGQPVDGTLWLALLARKPVELTAARDAIGGKVLTLGLVPAVTEEVRVLLPGSGPSDVEAPATFSYELPNMADSSADTGPLYIPLDARPKGNLLVDPGVVELPLPSATELATWRVDDLEPLEPGVGAYPPSLEETDVADRLITWIRIRVAESEEDAGRQLNARLSYVGANVARITQRARVFAEFVGQGAGEPNQAFNLVNTPVIPDSVQLTVNGLLWAQTDDLVAAPSEVPRARHQPGQIEQVVDLSAAMVYTVDRETGAIRFGDGLHGARPMRGAVIQAAYDYGGGLQGMVGAGAITRGPSLPAGVKVTNPVATWGSDAAETVAEAEQRVPHVIKHRNRLVAKEDFEEITFRTPGVDIGRVEILPLVHPDLPDFPAKGVVTVLVIPRVDPIQPEAPEPDRLFLDAVCAHLNPRRLLTTELHIRGPEYVPLYVSVGIDVVPGTDLAPVREAVKNMLRAFLSPLYGGFEAQGWPLDRDVDALELLAVAARVSGVAKVNGVLLAKGSEAEAATVSISGLMLPHLRAVGVRVGTPQPLDELRGVTSVAAPSLVPIPTIPAEC